MLETNRNGSSSRLAKASNPKGVTKDRKTQEDRRKAKQAREVEADNEERQKSG